MNVLRIRGIIILQLISLLLCSSIVAGESKELYQGQYLGQEPPGLTPEAFAPGIFSKSQPDWVFSTAFTPAANELYFSRFNPALKIDQIMHISMDDDERWSNPTVALFNNDYSANDVRISPGGNRLFFRSNRPLLDNKNSEKRFYIWFVSKENNSWSAPRVVECGGIPLRTGDLGVAENGTLYFAYRSGTRHGVFRSRFKEGKYGKPEFVISKNDKSFCEGDTFVAPDESYIIVSCWDLPENNGECDLYISFRKEDGQWSALRNIGNSINSKGNENCVTLSPDGKYLFYLIADSDGSVHTCSTYWVDAEILDVIKNSAE